MSGYGTEILKGQTTYINGERVTVTDTSDAFCVTVTDSDGNQMSVRRSTLMSTPLFDFNQKIINQNRERITEYRAKAQEYEQARETALKEQKSFLAQINNLFKDAGTRISSLFNAEQKELYNGLIKDYWSSRHDVTAASNGAYSCYMRTCDIAHDNAMLSSQIC